MSFSSIGHYRVDARLGQGGMGEVYLAFDTRLNRPVAVKVMRAGSSAGDQAQRFLREARAASALNHPNIVIVHEIGETETGEPFIVQEFIQGQTLRALLTEALPLERAIAFARQIAQALAAAHAAGVVHRDIKPENVMVRADGFVKMLDFGLARVAPAGTADLETRTNFETAPGVLLGTPAYLSPEQATGNPAGPPSDVFSLGVVLYELLGGRRPFVAPTPLGQIAAVISAHPVPLTAIASGIPRALSDLVQSMLDKDPSRRPTAADVESRLAGLAAPDSFGRGPSTTVARTTVGRETERQQLWRAFGRARDGQSSIVAITGEPGIGKTSLVEEFAAELNMTGERVLVARGRCSESLAGSEAYLPVFEALDSLLHHVQGPSLDSMIRTVAPMWYAQVVLHTSNGSAIGEFKEAPAAAAPDRMKRELGALLGELSRLHPVVWILEDLHWADVSTVDLLNYLAGRFDGLRLLVLATYRPSDMALGRHPFLSVRSNLQMRGLLQELPLAFLSVDDVSRFLERQFPGHAFPTAFAEEVHAKTEGSPLFMADLVRYLRDTGALVERDGKWTVSRSLADSPRDLPESVRGMIARKIDQLDDQDRALLLAASVQGHEFDTATVSEVAGMDAAQVEDRLERLERVHVLVKRDEEYEFPDRTLTLRYRFVHVLYQNVLHASLQPTRRTQLSGRTAQTLLAHHGSDVGPIAGRVAVLFEGARDFTSAARFFLVAARRAVSLFAFPVALSLADRGLEGLRGLSSEPERQQLELGLQMVKGLALRSVKGWAAPELEATFARARQICQELENPPELFPVLWNLAFFRMIRGDLPAVRAEIALLRTQADTAEEPAYRMAVDHLAGVTDEFGGELTESSRLLEEARALHDPQRHKAYTAMFGIDPGMIARAMSSRPLWALGHPDAALARSVETIALCRSQRQPVTLVFALIVAQGIHLYRGEAERAIELGDEIIALCREYEFPQEAEWARAFQGSAQAARGDLSRGIEQLRAALAALSALRSGLVRPTFLSLFADALCRAGQVDEGLAAVDEGIAHALQTTECGFIGELHRVKGELLALRGDTAAAEASLRSAVSDAQARSAKSFELRATSSLARLLDAGGRREEARSMLSEIVQWFTEGRTTADVVTAHALLSELV